MECLHILVPVGRILGWTSNTGLTWIATRFPSEISSCSGCNGSMVEFSNSSCTMATTLPGLETRENELRQKMNWRVIKTNIRICSVSLKIRRETVSISKISSHFDAVKLATGFQLKGKMVGTFALERNIRERNFGLRRRDRALRHDIV